MRILGDRLACFRIPPYKPPHRRHGKWKAWVDVGPVALHAILEVDVDHRHLSLEVYG